ncbi:probable E3 ubiquitin-protein ligase ATL44 [Brachypodium distachyon]|uniref:probable E3 ubiquitin-protein ligase ATL44 n=1 Tax=Brachypodium distachyon TaxID=15368 RepID=UPI0001C7485A|nr:probable E3 ubiquitin-protein ligase ATL44 [Brachypodium distachyon]|eukprot:XP_003573175.1 probable E3 ubiquitin-protein ligase ATL44 [Brachypodium distachyon]
MRTPASLIHSSTTAAAAAAAPVSSSTTTMISIDSNMVVILASLLCALVCLSGLAIVTRCACRRGRRHPPLAGIIANNSLAPLPPPARGLKKKAIDALPVVTTKGRHGQEEEDDQCAICLADFAKEEEELIRVLPGCGHGFHVACIDTWLRAHATCPSCRATITDETESSSPPRPLPGRCRRCGAACSQDDDNVAAHTEPPAATASRDETSFLP